MENLKHPDNDGTMPAISHKTVISPRLAIKKTQVAMQLKKTSFFDAVKVTKLGRYAKKKSESVILC